ncbi:MAG TPA: hypothetical protein VGI40_03705 [Pirellulaceae bacterium]|jgi:hypothetical protein
MLRFTIRDLLWLTVVVALAVGWWLDHRQFDSFDRAMILSLKKQRLEGREWGEYPQLSPNADSNPPATLNEP